MSKIIFINKVIRTRQVAANVEDLVSVLARSSGPLRVRFVDENLNTTALAVTLVSALLLLTTS